MAPYRRGRCQCLLKNHQNQNNNIIMDEPCPNDSLDGSAFCKAHQDRCEFKSPMTGYEPKYD